MYFPFSLNQTLDPAVFKPFPTNNIVMVIASPSLGDSISLALTHAKGAGRPCIERVQCATCKSEEGNVTLISYLVIKDVEKYLFNPDCYAKFDSSSLELFAIDDLDRFGASVEYGCPLGQHFVDENGKKGKKGKR